MAGIDQDFNPQDELDSAISESSTDILDDDLEALIRDRFQLAPDEEETGPSEPVEQPGEESSPAEVTPPESEEPPSEELSFDFDGYKVTREVAETYARFDQFLQEYPDVAEAIREQIRSRVEGTPPPTPPPTEPPVELDLDDPQVKFLWDNYQLTQQRLAAAEQLIQQHNNQLSAQTESTTASIVNRAVSSFQKERGLNDEQMNSLRKVAGNMNVIESVLGSTDPITGVPVKIDPLTAVEKALDIAYWSIPEYREKEITRQLEANRQVAEKKRKLSSLGGSSGSTPREQPQPQTREEVRAAMIREVAETIGVPPAN